MSHRHNRAATIGEYFPFHINTFTGVVANPTTQATGVAGVAGTLAAGAYTIAYTWQNGSGQSSTIGTSTSATITTTGAGTSSIAATAPALPTGATGVQWWLISAPGGVALGATGAVQAGPTFTITAPGNAASPPVNNNMGLVRLPQTISAFTPILDYGHGTFLGTVILNDPGTSTVFTLYQGSSGAAASIFCRIVPTTNVTLNFESAIDMGLWYAYSGTTAGSITMCVLPQTI